VTESEWPQLPVRLPGLDIAEALARLGNDVGLYLDLTGAYGEVIRDFVDQFRLLVGSLDDQGARRSAHTLKGAAGTIGAGALQLSASALEQVCRQGDLGQAMTLLPAVENDIAEVLASLARIRKPDPDQ